MGLLVDCGRQSRSQPTEKSIIICLLQIFGSTWFGSVPWLQFASAIRASLKLEYDWVRQT